MRKIRVPLQSHEPSSGTRRPVARDPRLRLLSERLHRGKIDSLSVEGHREFFRVFAFSAGACADHEREQFLSLLLRRVCLDTQFAERMTAAVDCQRLIQHAQRQHGACPFAQTQARTDARFLPDRLEQPSRRRLA